MTINTEKKGAEELKLSENWILRKDEQEKFITALTNDLAPLRAKVGITQGELAHLIGISRQTYCAIERGKQEMSWNTYLSLILFFDYNQCTHQMVRAIGAFPDELVERFNNGTKFMKYNLFMTEDKKLTDISDMLQALDEQGIHALKTMLLLEYGRCTNSLDEVIMKAGEKQI